MRIFISTCEPSGDVMGCSLIKRIRELMPISNEEIEIETIAGVQLAQQPGIKVITDSKTWGALGVINILGIILKVLKCYFRIRKVLRTGNPGLFIPIDSGFFNIRIARLAKSLGWKVLYFFPPGSWRRENQGADLPHVTDAIVTPFDWSAKMLNEMGCDAYWFGHPIKQQIIESSVPQIKVVNKVAILPGSRWHEIRSNLPVLTELFVKNKDLYFELAVSPNFSVQKIQRLWVKYLKKLGHYHDPNRITFTENDTYGVLKRSSAGIICSGTATLEAALCDCPCIVMYNLVGFYKAEAKIRNPKFKYVSLPNIILDRMLLPEFLLEQATCTNIQNTLRALLHDSSQRKTQLEGFKELQILTGPIDAITKTAELAIQMLTSSQSFVNQTAMSFSK